MENSKVIEEKCMTILTTMFDQLGIVADLSIGEPRAKGITVMIDTKEPGRLIGRGGVYLDSLQQVVNRILKKQAASNEEDATYVYLVISSERPAKATDEEQPKSKSSKRFADGDLEKIKMAARDRAKEVKKWGKVMSIGPYNSAQRRAVHIALRDDPMVETESQETENPALKLVLIKPVETTTTNE